MSDMTAEKKLALVRSIREENYRNRINMRNRQSILSGFEYDGAVMNNETNLTNMSQKRKSTFGLRLILAIVLVSIFLIWDYTDSTWFSVNTANITDAVKENYGFNIIDFVGKITYTLKE